MDAETGRQVRFGSKGIEHRRYCARIRGLHTAHHSLDMVLVIGGTAGMTVAASTGLLHHRQVGGVGATAHRAVRLVSVKRQRIAAVTDHAAERLDRVRWADLGQVAVTGEAIFRFAGQGWNQEDRLRLA